MDIGPLERYQLRFLFNNYPEFVQLSNSKKCKTTFEMFLFGFDMMQAASIDDIGRLHSVFDDFKKSKGPVCLALALGITNHWTGFVAYKDKGKVQMIFLDSKNQAHLNVNDENIVDFAHEHNKQRVKMRKSVIEGFRWDVFIQSLKDTRKALHIIKDCLTTDSTIYNYHLQTQLNIVLRSYNKYFSFAVNGGHQNEKADIDFVANFEEAINTGRCDENEKQRIKTYIERLNIWLKDDFRPFHIRRGIYNMIQHVGSKRMFKSDVDRLKNWCKKINNVLTDENLKDFESQIQGFNMLKDFRSIARDFISIL